MLRCRFQITLLSNTCSATQSITDMLHQAIDILTAMISGDVGVKVSPQTFDLVFVGAVWRQKVQYELSSKLLYRSLRNLAGVYPKVVQNHMNHGMMTIAMSKFFKQLDEQSALLSFAFHPDQTAGYRIHGAGEITFDVLPHIVFTNISRVQVGRLQPCSWGWDLTRS